jgi:hypothetical protein
MRVDKGVLPFGLSVDAFGQKRRFLLGFQFAKFLARSTDPEAGLLDGSLVSNISCALEAMPTTY